VSSDELQIDESTDTGRYQELRGKIAERPTLNLAYRITVGVVGTLVLALGIVLIPYPGPGWVVVFAGLGILASEFEWAHRALRWVKKRYDRFMDWFTAQGLLVKSLGVLLTAAVVVATLWVLGTFSMVGGWFGLEWEWLKSPLS
jgi:uncharacterized protein (TIGR02611 family)